jgi:hypothetical protein
MSTIDEQPEDQESFEVVELESEDGEVEDFVIVDKLHLDEIEYVILASLEDVESMEDMTDEELRILHASRTILFVMRVEGEDYVELTDEEYKSIESPLMEKLEAGKS